MHSRRISVPAVGLVHALMLATVVSCGPSTEEPTAAASVQVQELVAGGGPVILGGDDLTDHGSVSSSGQLQEGWIYIRQALESLHSQVRRSNDGTIAVLGSSAGKDARCCDAGAAYVHASQAAGLAPNFYEGADAIDQFFADLRSGGTQPAILVMVGTGALNDLDHQEALALTRHALEIANFVNSGGGLISHGSGPDAYGWLQALIPGIVESESAGCDVYSLTLTADGQAAFPGLTNPIIQAGPCHSAFSGDLGELRVLAADGQGRNIILGGASAQLPGVISLSPASVTYVVGAVSSHTVTATVKDGQLHPIPGATITFRVGSGPNAGRTGTAVSNTAGEASFTYPASTVGTDLITARFVDPTGATQTSPAAEAIWKLPDNRAPVARCQNVAVDAGPQCGVAASVNNGSSDPDSGDSITCTQTPGGPYAPGAQQVTLRCTDSHGVSASCSATVTVTDREFPQLTCPAPTVLECTGGKVPVGPATMTDNCMPPTVLAGGPGNFGLGQNNVTFHGSDPSGNTSTCNTSVTVVDTKAPTLTLVGPSELSVGCGGSMTQGVKATDVCAGDISYRVQVVGAPPSLPGTYQVSYQVSDYAGNTAQGLTRTVTVLDGGGDPVLVLNGDSTMQLECGVDTWVDPSAVATNGCGQPMTVHKYNTGDDDGDGIPGSQDPDDFGPGPNASVEGTYSVQYMAWDEQWNISSAIRTVNVADTRAPTLTLNGPARMTFTCGSGNFVDPGATASDSCYGNLTQSVEHSGWVNSWAAGTYTVTYSVQDSAGHSAAPVTRTVDVVNCPW